MTDEKHDDLTNATAKIAGRKTQLSDLPPRTAEGRRLAEEAMAPYLEAFQGAVDEQTRIDRGRPQNACECTYVARDEDVHTIAWEGEGEEMKEPRITSVPVDVLTHERKITNSTIIRVAGNVASGLISNVVGWRTSGGVLGMKYEMMTPTDEHLRYAAQTSVRLARMIVEEVESPTSEVRAPKFELTSSKE